MKKFTAILLILLSMTTPVWANEILVNYEGSPISFDAPPFLENDIAMVPVRAIAEKIGAEVLWSASSEVVTIKKEDNVISIAVDGNIAQKNGEDISLDMPTKIVADRVFVPLRFVGEQFGLNVVWDEQTKTIALTKKASKEIEQSIYMSKDNTYSVTLPGKVWQEEASNLENTLILSYVGERELSVLISCYDKGEMEEIETLQDFAEFNRQSVYGAIYAMADVTPQNITLTNMNAVEADEIVVKEKNGISKAFFVYAQTQKHYYICVITGTSQLYDQQINTLKQALQTITEKV